MMQKKVVSALVGGALLFGTTMGVYAGSNLQEIKAYLNGDMKVSVNGQPLQLKDAQGNPLLPITYKGSTYLPVRSVSTALNVPVDFDPKTNTVFIGERSEGVPILNEKFTNSDYSKDKKMTVYNGKDYGEVLYDVRAELRVGSFILEPKKKYKKLYLQIAAIGKDIGKIKIEDSDTKAILKTDTVALSDGMKTIEVDIAGVDSVYIYFENLNGDAGYMVPLTTSYYK